MKLATVGDGTGAVPALFRDGRYLALDVATGTTLIDLIRAGPAVLDASARNPSAAIEAAILLAPLVPGVKVHETGTISGHENWQ
jgi:hypothetical protein